MSPHLFGSQGAQGPQRSLVGLVPRPRWYQQEWLQFGDLCPRWGRDKGQMSQKVEGRAEREKKGDAHTERMAHDSRDSKFTVFAAVSP